MRAKLANSDIDCEYHCTLFTVNSYSNNFSVQKLITGFYW